MSKPKNEVQTLSAGNKLTLNKINEIIEKANDRRIIAHVTSVTGQAANDSDSVMRIEARSVVTTTTNVYGRAWVPFTSSVAFRQIPLVVCSWGDTPGLRSNDAGEGRVNPPFMVPNGITTEGFWVFGAREVPSLVRVNYIAVGPAS